MSLTRFAVAAAVGIGLAAPAATAAQETPGTPAPVAQEASGTPAAARESGTEAPAAAAETSALPVSLERIKRRMAAVQEAGNGRRKLLDLNYYVDVYARAPSIEIFRNFDTDSETVSYGSPTHVEMLEAVTPREWRPRAISTGALFGWR